MLDHRGLQDCIAFPNRVLPLPFILKGCPAIQDHDELKIAFVDVPLLHIVFLFLAICFDDMGNIVAIGAVFDPEIAIIKDLPKPRGLCGIACLIVNELPALGHW